MNRRKYCVSACLTLLLGVGTLMTTMAGTTTINDRITSTSHAVRNVAKTSNQGSTYTKAYLKGSPDVLRVKVSDQSTQQIQKHPIISVTEGQEASATYYSSANSSAGIGLRLDVYPAYTNLLPFDISVYVNYY